MEESTLLFRHLPSELSQEERKDLLHHIGATQVRLMGRSGPMKHTAFAVFSSKERAAEVVDQLHQAEFLGSTLVVEYAQKKTESIPFVVDGEGLPAKVTEEEEKDNVEELSEAEKKKRVPREIKFDTTFSTWGLKYPRRPELRYQYPPPTPSILTNIMHALAAVPKFYVQVLHLMNKMDLPAPFGMVTPKPPIVPDVYMASVPDDISQREMDISSSSESELDSGSGGERNKVKEVTERRSLVKKRRPHKKPRLSDLQDVDTYSVPSAPVLPVTEVFEKTSDSAPSRKIEMKISGTLMPPASQPDVRRLSSLPQTVFSSSTLYDPSVPTVPCPPLPFGAPQLSMSQPSDQLHLPPQPLPSQQPSSPVSQRTLEEQVAPPSEGPRLHSEDARLQREGNVSDFRVSEDGQIQEPVVGGFGILQPQPKETKNEEEDESSEQKWSRTRFISSSELKKSRLSESEMKELSVFRRYAAGEPSCRLYIKNLAKQVSEEDLHRIFGRHVDWDSETEVNIFDIRLMKEGRMKGQAFITFPNEDAAKSALKETNAFVLKDRPMVVQFARSAKAEEDKASRL
ncbi:RNA-binding region-containing protein 3 [Aplysia californica]|uniref:RNA-binding region-containing protein 3 n=1 Tax=Aplysia californica TaxID=6500 RepID=A0ABM0JMD7_APLCA|nr:RNA-binding region-containing protein 3 [Aplysia californica]